MKITVDVDVFDDPEYCQGKNKGCEYLDAEPEDYCVLLKKFLSHIGLYVKCKQCKEAYQRALSKSITGCICELEDGEKPTLCVLDDPDYCKSDCVHSENGMTKENCGFWRTINMNYQEVDNDELLDNAGAFK